MKVLLFVFVTLITNTKVVLSANTAFLDIQETTTSLSFHKETPKTVFMVIENDWVNRCQNEQDFVTYRGQGTGVETVAAKTGGKELFNFGTTAAKHMAEKGRAVPVQTLEQAIKSTKGVLDPRGSRALMHTTEMFKNGKPYNLEVLYDKATNSIWHFKYWPK